MDFCIYHSRDLDGLTSGAVIYAHQKQFGELVNLVGYDYGQKLDTRKFKGKVTVMIDVSMPMERMETLGLSCLEFIWIDHHISALSDFHSYCEEKGYKIRQTKLNDLIDCYEVLKMNMIYYYSSKLSACEIAASLYAQKLGKNARELVRTLGQYDTWRNTDEKKFLSDKDWFTEVLPVQWGMRILSDPIEIFKKLIAIDDWSTGITTQSIIDIGISILKYQKMQYETTLKNSAFEFELNGMKVLAINAPGYGSIAFDNFYYEEIHDLMISFYYNGKTNLWNVSLYTTKEDIDILSIAKEFGGGGHKMACGFTVPPDMFRIDKSKIEIGSILILDLDMLPKDFDINDKKKIQELMQGIKFMPLSDSNIEVKNPIEVKPKKENKNGKV